MDYDSVERAWSVNGGGAATIYIHTHTHYRNQDICVYVALRQLHGCPPAPHEGSPVASRW